MKLKTVVTTLGALSLAMAGTAFAGQSTDAQVAQLQAQVNKLQAQMNAMAHTSSADAGHANMGGFVQVSPTIAQNVLSTQAGVNTELSLLKGRKDGMNAPVYLTGQLKGAFDYSHFAPHNQTSQNRTHFNIAQTALGVMANVNDWMSAFVSLNNFGNDTGDTNTINVNDAYVVFGNLNKSPLYAFVGRKDVDFGNFQTVNFYTAPLNRAVFEAHGNTLGMGVYQNGFNGTVSFMNGGTTNNTNLSTENHNYVNNFAVNAAYGQTNNNVTWQVGAGYLNGIGFANQTTDANNQAWDINGQVEVAGLKVIAEYTQTVDKVVTNGSKVAAWNVGADYAFPVMGHNSVVNVSYSAVQGPNSALTGNNSDTNKKTFNQYVAGYNVNVMDNVWVGLEYTYNKGLLSQTVSNGRFDNVISAASDTNASTVALVGTAYF